MSTEEPRPPDTRGEAVRRVQEGLRRLTLGLHRLNDAVGTHIDLRAGDMAVLDVIDRRGPMPPRDVVAVTGIHPATLTGILDRLEEGGWLERSPDPTDRRRVTLTAVRERGGELVRLYGPMNRSIGEICADHTMDELAMIISFLGRITAAAADASADLRERSL